MSTPEPQLIVTLVGLAGVLNVAALGYQLFEIWKARSSQGVSLVMFCLFLFIQGMLTVHGWFIGDNLVFQMNLWSALCSLSILLSIIYFRKSRMVAPCPLPPEG